MRYWRQVANTMRQRTLVVATLAAAALLVAVPAAGLATVGDEANAMDTQANDTANGTAPGERLSGVVGVGEAELEGDLDERTFGIQVANASTQEAQADVVADRLADVEQRLAALEERKATLDQRRADGEISEGKYRAEVSKLAAETQTTKRMINQSAQVNEKLPADLVEERLAQRGINASAIQTLSERANELSGPEVAEIARGIAGPNVGDTPAGDRPVDVPERPERPGDDRPGDGGPGNDTRPGDGGPGDDRGPADDEDDEDSDGQSNDGGQ